MQFFHSEEVTTMPNILHKLIWKYRIMVVDIMILFYHKRNHKEAMNHGKHS